MRLTRSMAAAVLVLLAVPVSAQSDSPGIVHRSAAGALDARGWTDANSTNGAFAVRVPCLYDDISTKPTRPPEAGFEAPVVVFILRCHRDDNSTFDAMRFGFADPASAEKMFGQIIGLSKAPESDQRRFVYKGAPAVDYKLPVNEGQCTLSRIVRVGADDVLLVAGRPAASCDKLAADAAIFFDSLEIKPR